MCDPAAVQDVDDRALWAGAGAVCAALVAHDMDALRALTAEELWERAAAEELAPLAEHAVAARPLGLLGRHTMLHATTPGAAYPAYVVEQQWTPAATGPPLVEDERLFTLIDRAALEAAGDTDRLARLATKLAAQDAALGYVDALNASRRRRRHGAVDAGLRRRARRCHATHRRPAVGGADRQRRPADAGAVSLRRP